MTNKLFSYGEAIKFGWGKAKSNFGAFFLILVVSYGISGITSALIGDPKDMSTTDGVIRLVGLLVSLFIYMGLVRVLLKVHDDGKPVFDDFTRNPEQFGNFLLGYIFSTIVVVIGFVLLIIPGIIFYLRLQFTPYLIVEKNLGAVEAMKRSWAITRGYGWNLFGFSLSCGLIILLGFLALIIGAFWAIPTVMVAVAYVYRKLDRAPSAATQSVAA